MPRPLMIVTILAAVAAFAPAIGARPTAAFTVSSTLDHKTLLPHHIRWQATSSLPATQITEVDFLIDGKISWVERKPPYSYSDDTGYLVTSWLTAANHQFTVRAKAKDGRVAKDTVTARVAPASAPAVTLAGKWHRTVDPTGAPKPGTPGAPKDTPTPAGTYTLVFDNRWLQTRDPGTFTKASVDKNTGFGYIQDTDYQPKAHTFTVWGAVTWRPFSDYLAEEGTWCGWDGPAATYSWSVTGNTLTLKAVGTDACRVREFIWTGSWTR